MKYRYLVTSNRDLNKPHFRRPIVDVEIFGPKGSINTIALLDSGADNCLFNIGYAELIGIDLAKCEKAVTTSVEGGMKDVYLTNIVIRVKGLEKISVPIAFIDSDSVNSLLGQIGFFDQNKIKFERDHDIFEIIPVKKK